MCMEGGIREEGRAAAVFLIPYLFVFPSKQQQHSTGAKEEEEEEDKKRRQQIQMSRRLLHTTINLDDFINSIRFMRIRTL